MREKYFTTFNDWEKLIHFNIFEKTKADSELENNLNEKLEISQMLSELRNICAPIAKEFYSTNERNLEKIYAKFDGSKEMFKLIEDLVSHYNYLIFRMKD